MMESKNEYVVLRLPSVKEKTTVDEPTSASSLGLILKEARPLMPI